ncbi:MAG: hypothetical protein IJY27_07005, partial [Clostridia bacterium]|nr:hypothetical protein [Clostridia bacterium]
YFAQLRIFFRERKQPIFEAGVVCDDRSPIVSFIKIYLGRFMRFLNACNHIFQKPPIFSFREKHPHFAQKSLGLHRRYLRNSGRKNSRRAGHRLLLPKSPKADIPSVYTANHYYR